jgi:hypothetical protein
LIIDPVLAYSTLLGGDFDDSGNSIAVDRAGNAGITGFTCSDNFPVSATAFPEIGQRRQRPLQFNRRPAVLWTCS